ncbi:MAG: sulfur carrier protein ThiS adenylyltransferase ThiF [Brevinematales bacterium]|nr:sulfur carrier protein ThiS adenylyltransferase ThiF [Brevinematales bacterium]
MKVGIAGAGGLGSNIAMHLVRAGVSGIVIADFDVVEESNLNRQFYFRDQIGMKKTEAVVVNLKRIDPGAEINAVDIRLDSENIAGVFADCGIVAEAFDRADCKAMLLNALGGAGKKIVAASGVAGLYTEGIRTRGFGENIKIIGDFVSDNTLKPLYSAKVGTAAAIMAGIILEWMGYADEK